MLALYYKPRKISEIDYKNDSRVALIGRVVEVKENSFVLSDESGSKEILFEGSVEENKIARVFCSLLGEELRAEIIQSLNGLDINLFKKVEELYKKAESNV